MAQHDDTIALGAQAYTVYPADGHLEGTDLSGSKGEWNVELIKNRSLVWVRNVTDKTITLRIIRAANTKGRPACQKNSPGGNQTLTPSISL